MSSGGPRIPSDAVPFAARLLYHIHAAGGNQLGQVPLRASALFRSPVRLGLGRQVGIGRSFASENPAGQHCDADET